MRPFRLVEPANHQQPRDRVRDTQSLGETPHPLVVAGQPIPQEGNRHRQAATRKRIEWMVFTALSIRPPER